MPSKSSAPKKEKQNKAGVIEAVKTPLGLCALIVLVIEGILGAISVRLTGWDLTILLIGMIAALFVVVFAAAYAIRHPQTHMAQVPAEEPKPISFKYDVFLSVPMAGCSSEEDYRARREDGLKVIESLRTACGLKNVSYAARYIETLKDFDAADLSMLDDLQAIEESRYFVMIYTSKMLSSCLVEAGCAIALRKPSLYFVRDRKHLPFLLENAGQALDFVKIQDHDDVNGITKLLCKHQLKLFPSHVG